MEITKIENADSDNSIFIAKIPYEVKDEFGNKATFYRREELNLENLGYQKERLETQLAAVNAKLKAIGE